MRMQFHEQQAIAFVELLVIAIGLLSLSGCASVKAHNVAPSELIKTPQILKSHEVHPQTRYSLTTYAEQQQQLTVLRDQHGNKIAEILYTEFAVYLTTPGEKPVRIKRAWAPMVKDEFSDVWRGDQTLFSFIPLLYD